MWAGDEVTAQEALRFWWAEMLKKQPKDFLESTSVADAFYAGFNAGEREERQANANLAWEMQIEQFGGGTAIGNAIADGMRAEWR